MAFKYDNLRADARANRDRILDVARDVLTADPKASLHSIAKVAAVGQGTLYRHFPTREALVLGVYRNDIEALAKLASTLHAEHTPLGAFKLWCDQFAQYGRRKHGIADMVRVAMTDQDFRETYGRMLDAVSLLVNACKDAEEIDPNTSSEDVLQLLGLLMQLPPTAEGEARTQRLISLIFRGLIPVP